MQGGPASRPLPAPDATVAQDFTRVVAVGELADGRVLVSDAEAPGSRRARHRSRRYHRHLDGRPARILTQGRLDRATSIEITVNPLRGGDLATMFDDGTVAIARVAPYRVDWISPDGRLTRGGPLPFTCVVVSAREKDAVMKRQAEAAGREPQPPETYPDWPEVLPPFLAGALLRAPDGRLWIRRTPSADTRDTRYDVVDRTGALTMRVSLPSSDHVVGFGRNAVYSVQVDDDGIQHLRRHPLPRSVTGRACAPPTLSSPRA